MRCLKRRLVDVVYRTMLRDTGTSSADDGFDTERSRSRDSPAEVDNAASEMHQVKELGLSRECLYLFEVVTDQNDRPAVSAKRDSWATSCIGGWARRRTSSACDGRSVSQKLLQSMRSPMSDVCPVPELSPASERGPSTIRRIAAAPSVRSAP